MLRLPEKIMPKSFFTFATCTLVVALLGASVNAHAQKIKYKDLFLLLSAKQYAQAEPFLKRYLKENQENPNALLFMGFIYEEKALVADVLKETERQGVMSDSAIQFIDKAFKLIDERELKKNDEFYQMYNRRDLRTGEFGLKLSDVQFDLEKRIKALKDRKAAVLALKSKFLLTEKLYVATGNQYGSITSGYLNDKQLFLRGDQKLMSHLNGLGKRYDSTLDAFADFKAALKALGKTGYNQEVRAKEISDFKKEGTGLVDFYRDDLPFWDFKKWALSRSETIEKEVLPMWDDLVKVDVELNALREKIRKDSVSVKTELPQLNKRMHATGLEKFDATPYPFDLFRLKQKELEYGSEISATRHIRDSISLILKLNALAPQIKLLHEIDSLAGIAQQLETEETLENYKTFIAHAFGSAQVLKSMVKSLRDFSVVEKASKVAQAERIRESMKWIVDGRDSIPAMPTATSARFKSLSMEEEDFTAGVFIQDSAVSVYLYSIHPARHVKTKAVVKLDSALNETNFSLAYALSMRSAATPDFFTLVFPYNQNETLTKAALIKVNAHQGLIWIKYVSIPGLPDSIKETADGLKLGYIEILDGGTAGGTKELQLTSEGNLKEQ